MAAAIRTARSPVDLEGDEVALVHADEVAGGVASARSSSSSSWTSTSTSRPMSTASVGEVGQLGVVERGGDQQDAVRAHSRASQTSLADTVKSLRSTGSGDRRPRRREVLGRPAEARRPSVSTDRHAAPPGS